MLNEYSPIAAGFLGILIPIFEPVGWVHAEPGTLLGYQPSFAAVVAIAVSAGLGLLVSLSTFLVIGATSSLTYNVVGHIKTVIILMGGCMFFGDQMPLKKLAGISVAMMGIIWYSQVHNPPLADQLAGIVFTQIAYVLAQMSASGSRTWFSASTRRWLY